jgi:two-component system sensor histidine kinase AlgZ
MASLVWILFERRRVGGPDSWRRPIRQAALVAWIILAIPSFLEGLRDGFTEGYKMGAEMAAADRREQGLPPRPPKPAPGAELRFDRVPPGFSLTLWVLMTALGTRVILQRDRHREESERQERLAREAREQALRSRLAPHFLFNALNTLHAQIESDPRGAQATTERLARIFRKVLENAERPTVPLQEEWELVEAYLGLEQARLGSRLQVRMELPEDLESAPVPPLSLQVLVENAVKHGVAPLEEGGEVNVKAERTRTGDLRVTVTDPGSGSGATPGTGTALETLRQRLARPGDLEMGMRNGRHEATLVWRLPGAG